MSSTARPEVANDLPSGLTIAGNGTASTVVLDLAAQRRQKDAWNKRLKTLRKYSEGLFGPEPLPGFQLLLIADWSGQLKVSRVEGTGINAVLQERVQIAVGKEVMAALHAKELGIYRAFTDLAGLAEEDDLYRLLVDLLAQVVSQGIITDHQSEEILEKAKMNKRKWDLPETWKVPAIHVATCLLPHSCNAPLFPICREAS